MSAKSREYAEGKVKKYINDNFSRFMRIQVRQMIHLPCFTDMDKQYIGATCERLGNDQTVFTFFDHLYSREGWVPLLIEALKDGNMEELGEELQQVYHRYLFPSPRTSPRPAANTPSDAPLQPQANKRSSREVGVPLAIPLSPNERAIGTTYMSTLDTGDYHTPIQENHHPAEKSELAVKPKDTGKAREPDISPPSNSNAAPNIRAAVRGEKATETQVVLPEKESSSIPGPVEARPLLPPTASTVDAGSVEQKWDGRQHRPVTVKNGCFGNKHRPDDSVTVSALPADAPKNQPEEDYYSTDSFLFAPGGQKGSEMKDLSKERKVHVLRVDQNQIRMENPAVVDSLQSSLDEKRKSLPGEKLGVNPKASHRSAEDPTQLFSSGPSPRSSSANSARLPHTQTGTKPPSQVCNTTADQQVMETRPPAVVDHKRDNHIFCSNHTENDKPPKPGVLSSVSSEDAELHTKVYSGTSERFCMSDPILVSDCSLAGNPTASTILVSGAGDASLPPADENCEDDSSIRIHHQQVVKNPSMDLMGAPEVVPLDFSRPSPSAFPPASQPEKKAKDLSENSLPDQKAKAGTGWTANNSVLLFAGFALASVVVVAFVLYKKK